MKVINRSCILVLVLLFNVFNSVAQTEDAAPKPLKTYEKDRVKVNSYDFNGLKYFLEQSNDTTYVVNFWATWCLPCVEELPYFEKLNAEYVDKKVKVILVSLDMAKQVESRLIPFMQKRKLASKVILLHDLDANAWIEKVDKSWSGAIPATVIYKNKQTKFFERSFTYQELEKEVQQFNP